MIEAALAESQGQISGPSGAAKKLGLPARTLDSKIKRLRINKYRFKVSRASPVFEYAMPLGEHRYPATANSSVTRSQIWGR